MIKILTLILIIISFFFPIQVSWFLVAFYAISEGYLIISSRNRKFSSKESTLFSEEEQVIIGKYYLYFKYPLTAKSLSSSLSLIALSAIPLVPWFLYNHLWIQAVIIGFNFFVAQFISSKLNIRFYLHDAVERLKQEQHKKEMELVDSVCNKISNSTLS